MTTTNQTRRTVMNTAWVIFREGRQIRDGRTFAQSLTWAWRQVKFEAAKARNAALRVLRVAPSMIRSPQQRLTSTAPLARQADFKAALTTARLGG